MTKIERMTKIWNKLDSFEVELTIEERAFLALKLIKIYDSIDSYLLSEEDDEKVYEMYSRARQMLVNMGCWWQPEEIPFNVY